MMAGFSPELLSVVALSVLKCTSAVSLASCCEVSALEDSTQMTHVVLFLRNYLKIL